MGFWPYFLQEKSSGGISAIFMLIAGILTTLLTFDFLIKIKLGVNGKVYGQCVDN